MRMPPILLGDVAALVDGAGENPRLASKIPNYPATLFGIPRFSCTTRASAPGTAVAQRACQEQTRGAIVTNQVHEMDSVSRIPVEGKKPDKGLLSAIGADFWPESVADVDVRWLPPGTALTVDTRNSRYQIVILDGATGRATMQGGTLFQEPTEVRIEGSTAGGSQLTIGSIGLGLHLEFSVWDHRVVTSRVRAIHSCT
jgi:hypothetical protein